MLTFRDLQLGVGRWIDESEDTDTTLALIKDGLNRSHRKLLGQRTWPFMAWPQEVSFNTVVGQRTYALKHGVSKLLTLWDNEFNAPCPLISRRDWELLEVDRVGAQSVPFGAIYGDVWPVKVQPTSEAVTATSTTDTDTARTVVLEGLNTSGDYATETLTLADAGSTASATGTTEWDFLMAVTKTGTWTGTLTLSAAAAGTLLTLTSGEYGKQYPTVEFIETPREARTYLYTAQRTPRLLTLDYDIPDTPYPYSEIHIYDTLLDLTAYNTELGAKEQRLWKSRYDEIWAALINSVDEGIAGSRPRYVRRTGQVPSNNIHVYPV